MNLPLDEFIELYTEAVKAIRIDRMWLAYVIWKPEMYFKEFLEKDSESKSEETGVYIDQIGF